MCVEKNPENQSVSHHNVSWWDDIHFYLISLPTKRKGFYISFFLNGIVAKNPLHFYNKSGE